MRSLRKGLASRVTRHYAGGYGHSLDRFNRRAGICGLCARLVAEGLTMALYAHTHLGMPAPRHTLTEAAEAARVAVRQLPPSRLVEVITKSGVTMKTSRAPLTRREVEEAYVHPASEMPAEEVLIDGMEGAAEAAAHRFATKADIAGADVKVTIARGTTLPKWHVNAPDSKPNPGPPVDAAQYHGEVVDSVVVWAVKREVVACLVNRRGELGRVTKVRAEWHNGRIYEVTVNGAKSSLKAALEALGATS